MHQTRKPIFLSHKSEDFPLIKKTLEYLEERNIPCWYAPRNIQFGDKYDLRIAEDLEHNVEAVIVFITNNVGKSTEVPKEITLADRFGKIIIPIVYHDEPTPKSLQYQLSQSHQLALYEDERDEQALDLLVERLEIMYTKELEIPQKLEAVNKQVRRLGKRIVFRIPKNVREKVDEIYVEPEEYSSCLATLQAEHIVVIENMESVGKYTTALRLHNQLQVEEIVEWPKGIPFIDIDKEVVEERTGYIIEVESLINFFKTTSEYEVESYIARLKENGSYLVLTVRDNEQHMLKSFAEKVTVPLSKNEMIIKHYKYMNGTSTDIFHELLNRMVVQHVLPLHLLPREAVQIAKDMKMVLTGQINEDVFFNSQSDKSLERVKTWFKINFTIDSLALYLIIGLFNGQRFTTISKHASQLEVEFQKSIQFDNTRNLLESLDEKLKKLHASTSDTMNARSSQSTRSVHLHYPADGQIIWEYAWFQYPEFRKPIAEWVKSYFADRKIQHSKQKPLIQMIVRLAKIDFHETRETLIMPFANSTDPQQRMIAVRLLEELALDYDYAYKVHYLAKSWANLINNEPLQKTAIILLGGVIGKVDFLATLNVLLALIEDKRARKSTFLVKNSLSNLSQLISADVSYQSMYFNFWKDAFARYNMMNSKLYSVAFDVFSMNPQLVFETNKQFIKGFWINVFTFAYYFKDTRAKVEQLLNRVCTQANQPSRRKLVIQLIILIQDNLTKRRMEEAREDFRAFIETLMKHDNEVIQLIRLDWNKFEYIRS